MEQNDTLLIIARRKTLKGDVYPPMVTFFTDNLRDLSDEELKMFEGTLKELCIQYDIVKK